MFKLINFHGRGQRGPIKNLSILLDYFTEDRTLDDEKFLLSVSFNSPILVNLQLIV